MSDAWRPVRIAAVACAVAACANTLMAGDSLSGYWSSGDTHLAASGRAVTFTMPCETATFGPIVLESDLTFSATSVSFSETGNVIHFPDDELRMQGKVSGDQVMLTIYVVRSEPPVSDPIALTLTSGGSHDTPVCPA